MEIPQKDDASPHKNGVLPSPTHGKESVPTQPPPADKLPGVKDPLLLIPQLLLLLLVILPSILYSFLRKIFPPAGKSLKDKVVIVTGAGRGLGRGLALEFAREGAKVAVVDVFHKIAKETAKEIEAAGGIAKGYIANVAKVEDIRRLRDLVTADFGPVDIIVNNAGLMYGNHVEDMTESDVKGVMEVNILSHFWMAKEFLPSMKERNAGHIVAISSCSAFCGLGRATAYSCSKSGVMGFMDALRQELNSNPDNKIKTTTVFPYFINTSAQYINAVDLRIPPVSIDKAVNAIIAGVKKEEVSFTVPEDMFYSIHLFMLFPQNVVDMFRGVFYTKVNPPTLAERNTQPVKHIIDKLSINV